MIIVWLGECVWRWMWVRGVCACVRANVNIKVCLCVCVCLCGCWCVRAHVFECRWERVWSFKPTHELIEKWLIRRKKISHSWPRPKICFDFSHPSQFFSFKIFWKDPRRRRRNSRPGAIAELSKTSLILFSYNKSFHHFYLLGKRTRFSGFRSMLRIRTRVVGY